MRFRIIPNGLNAHVFDVEMSKQVAREKNDLQAGTYLIGHSGRFDASKNHETWFKVAQKLSRKYTDVRFLFFGKGTDSAAFLQQLKQYGIAERTTAMGLCEDVPVALRAMDLFYFPSVTEGQPNALIEAMLVGIPVVAANIAPIQEIIPAYAQHQLVDPLDVNAAVELIEKHYHKIASDYSTALKGWAMEKFDFDKNFKAFEDEIS